jgi:hypothetical protein
MIKMKNRRKNIFGFGIGTVFSILVVAILISPAIADSALSIDDNPEIESNYENEPNVFTHSEYTHPDYYDITVWRFRFTSYEEEVIRVSYDEAMEIKAAYEQIESNNNDLIEQAKQKNAVLRNYGVLSSDDTLENYEKEFKKFEKTQPITIPLLRKIMEKMLNDLGYNWPLMDEDMAFACLGFLIGYLHGHVMGFNFGIPGIAGIQLALGFSPSEGLGCVFGAFPCSRFTRDEPGYGIIVMIGFGVGFMTYLPFFFNLHSFPDTGRFDICVASCLGLMMPG